MMKESGEAMQMNDIYKDFLARMRFMFYRNGQPFLSSWTAMKQLTKWLVNIELAIAG